MKKLLFFVYGVVAYAIFFATYCYAVGFVTNLVVPQDWIVNQLHHLVMLWLLT